MIEVEGTPEPLKETLQRFLEVYCLPHKVKKGITPSALTRVHEHTLDLLIEAYRTLPRQAVAILRELFSVAIAENKTFLFPGMNKQTENGTLNENTLLVALDLGDHVKSGHT